MAIHTGDDEETLFLQPDAVIIGRGASCCRNDGSSRHRLDLLVASLLLNVVLVSVVIRSLVQSYDFQLPSNDNLKKVSAFSPLFDQIDLSLHPQQFNGRLHDNSSIFRHDPSPEVDQAWETLSGKGYEIITVNAATISKIGKNPSISVKAPSDWGRGGDAYLAQVDVFHQIHCLNELRKEIYFDHYYGKTYNRTSLPREHTEHKKHCLHMLLQNLVCHVDVDIVTHNWVHYSDIGQPDRPFAEPFADFNTIKQCRNFDGLLKWVQREAVEDVPQKWKNLRKPEGVEFVLGDGYF